jgi:hypothetical protein
MRRNICLECTTVKRLVDLLHEAGLVNSDGCRVRGSLLTRKIFWLRGRFELTTFGL